MKKLPFKGAIEVLSSKYVILFLYFFPRPDFRWRKSFLDPEHACFLQESTMLHPEVDLDAAWDKMSRTSPEECQKDPYFRTVNALTLAYEFIFDSIWRGLKAVDIEINLINYV